MSTAAWLVDGVGRDPRGSTNGERVDWQVVHSKLLGLAKSRAGLDWEEGRWLVLAQRGQLHVRMGYGSFAEYVERLFGYGGRFVREKLRVAEALERLPATAAKLRDGEISWTVARELTRVAVPETESEWLAAAQGKSAREVERLVSGHVLGNRPSDLPDDAARRHTLRFEVSGEVLATFREAIAKLRRDAGDPLDDEATLLLMARHVLQGPADAGRASYQVAMSVCPSCRRGDQQASGEAVRVDEAVVAMAECDGQHLHEGATATQTIPPATRRAVLHRDRGCCVFPGCRNGTFVDVHHIVARAASTGLRFWHADGSAYGTAISAAVVDARARTFRALRGLGFAEREARRALASATPGGHHVEQLLRHCLQTLTGQKAG